MSQNSLTLPTTGTVSGLQMTQYANNALDTLNTLASGASAPSSPEAGQLWHDTSANIIKLRSLDNTSWIALFSLNESAYLASPSYASQGTGSLNRIINGAMEIDQANEGASYTIPTTNTFTYATDQWEIICKSSTASGVTAQRVADAPPGFTYSLKVTVGTGASSVGSTDVIQIQQPLESQNLSDLNYGSSNAAAGSLSFWVKSSATGTYSVLLANAGGARTYVTTFSITSAGSWQQVKLPALPGDQSGTWPRDNTQGLSISIIAAAGTGTQTGTLNAWQSGAFIGANTQTNTVLTTSGATFQITGAMFNPGSFCLPFEKRSIQQELYLCERYFQKSFPLSVAAAQNAGYAGAFALVIAASSFGASMRLRTAMRASPTLITYNPLAGNANWRDTGGSDLTSTAFVIGGDSIALYGAGGAAGHEARIHFSCNARM